MNQKYCVECGRPIPSGSETVVCRHCQLTAGCNFMKCNCPECGQPMTIWYKEAVEYRPAAFDQFWCLKVDLIYHCECGCDWDSNYIREFGDESQSALTRHYWG